MNTQVLDVASRVVVDAGRCIPSNTTLSDPLTAPIGFFIGSFWGIVAIVVVVAIVVMVIILIARSNAQVAVKVFQSIGVVVATPIAAYFIAMLYFILSGNLPSIEACPF